MWTDTHTHTQTEKDVNPTSRYSTGFSKRNKSGGKQIQIKHLDTLTIGQWPNLQLKFSKRRFVWETEPTWWLPVNPSTWSSSSRFLTFKSFVCSPNLLAGGAHQDHVHQCCAPNHQQPGAWNNVRASSQMKSFSLDSSPTSFTSYIFSEFSSAPSWISPSVSLRRLRQSSDTSRMTCKL